MEIIIELNELEEQMMGPMRLVHGNDDEQVLVSSLYAQFRKHNPPNRVHAAMELRKEEAAEAALVEPDGADDIDD